MTQRYNPPPNWPSPPQGWTPPPGWVPDPSWGPAPSGWQFWADEPGKAGMPLAAKVVLGVVAAFVGICGIGLIGAALGGDPDDDTASLSADRSKSPSATTDTEAAEKAAEDQAATDKAAADAEAAEKAAEDQAAADKAAAAAAAAAEAANPGIGSKVRDGKFEFTVTGVERPGKTIGESFFEETAQGEFIIIRVDITNIGDEAQTLTSSSQVLYNDKGQKFEPSSAIFALEDSSKFFLETINPGNTVTGAPLLFDVAPGTVLDKIELHDSFFSGGVEVSLKGS